MGASTTLNAYICIPRPKIESVRCVYQVRAESTDGDDVILLYIGMWPDYVGR